MIHVPELKSLIEARSSDKGRQVSTFWNDMSLTSAGFAYIQYWLDYLANIPPNVGMPFALFELDD